MSKQGPLNSSPLVFSLSSLSLALFLEPLNEHLRFNSLSSPFFSLDVSMTDVVMKILAGDSCEYQNNIDYT